MDASMEDLRNAVVELRDRAKQRRLDAGDRHDRYDADSAEYEERAYDKVLALLDMPEQLSRPGRFTKTVRERFAVYAPHNSLDRPALNARELAFLTALSEALEHEYG